MATVLEILNRASRITGLRYDGAADSSSEAEILRQALEDVYIDIMLEVNHHEAQYRVTIGPNQANVDQSIELYNKATDFDQVVDEPIAWPTGLAPNTIALLNQNGNPSGKIRVTNVSGTVEYVEGVDFNVDRHAVTGVPESLTSIVGAAFDQPGTVFTLATYFLQDPGITINGGLLIPPFLKLRNVVYQQGNGSVYPLQYISNVELLEYRRGFESAGFSRFYSITGNAILNTWPNQAPGDQITINYVPLPPKLDEIDNRPAGRWDEAIWDLSQWDDFRGVESTPSLIPIQFHWNTLLAGVVVQAFDKDQRITDAQFWQARYEAGLAKMHLWAATYGNIEPAVIFDGTTNGFFKWPDQYNRSGGS